MNGARTRGHPAALAAIGAMVRAGPPGAVLLVGPEGVGKTTLALDLAAALLCTADDPSARPCGACRACRLVLAGVHPDVHRLAPDGPGRQVVIGGGGSKVRGIRDLIAELALLPVEGGARVAIVESAHRMNEDAQAALLKTLEEPPAGDHDRAVRRRRGAAAAHDPVALRPASDWGPSASATSRRSSARPVPPNRRSPRGSPGSPADDPAWRSPGWARRMPCASATPSAGH